MRTAISLLSERDHPLRRALVDELHVRRIPPFAAPLNMTQIVMFIADEQANEVREHAKTLCAHFGVALPVRGRYFSVQLGDIHFVWESHAEFSTYSFVRPGPVRAPFAESVLEGLPLDWIQTLPGQTIRATQVVVLDKSAPSPDPASLGAYFDMDELVCARMSRTGRHGSGPTSRCTRMVSAGSSCRILQAQKQRRHLAPPAAAAGARKLSEHGAARLVTRA